MKQEYLIDRIINAVGFNDDNDRSAINPVVKPPLHKDLEGLKRKHAWNYRSVLGMLNYLEKKLRPDIAYEVH